MAEEPANTMFLPSPALASEAGDCAALPSAPFSAFDSLATPASAATATLNLTRGLAAGDQSAFLSFYELCFATMFHEATRCLGRSHEVRRDVVHEAVLKAVRCMPAIDNQAALHAYCRAVVRSVAYDWLRKTHREGPFSSVDQQDQSLCTPKDDGWEQSEWDARSLWLEEQLRNLEPGLRRLIHWRYRLGWNLRQIAEQLGMKTGAVDGRIRRAVEKLKQHAKEQFGE